MSADIVTRMHATALWTWLRSSSLPYVGSLVITCMVSGYAAYLNQVLDLQDLLEVKGQALGISVPILCFPITLVLWLIYQGRRSVSRWVEAFLIGLVLAWLFHQWLSMFHGDLYTHTVWLYVPLVIMLILKTPNSAEAWKALFVLAWIAALILVLTRLMEIGGAVPMFNIPDLQATEWEKTQYWLPFSGYFGLNGRWPGPFGFNSMTGYVSAFLIVFGLARWSKSSWAFVIVGALGVVLTGGRAPYLSVFAGLLVLALLANRGPIARIPMTMRATVGAVAVLVAGLAMFFSPLSTTGRIGENGIWNSFLDLWKTSPWLGVGQTGIWDAPGRAGEAMDAHSVYIQELAEYGIAGFTVQYLVLGLGIAIAIVAAVRGFPGPFAVIVVYLVSSMTAVMNDGWASHSMYTVMFILSVIAAGAWLSEKKVEPAPEREVSELETAA
jgi:hypothetical protein